MNYLGHPTCTITQALKSPTFILSVVSSSTAFESQAPSSSSFTDTTTLFSIGACSFPRATLRDASAAKPALARPLAIVELFAILTHEADDTERADEAPLASAADADSLTSRVRAFGATAARAAVSLEDAITAKEVSSSWVCHPLALALASKTDEYAETTEPQI